MEGLTEKWVESVFGKFCDSHNNCVKKAYCQAHLYNIFYFKVGYIVLFGMRTHLREILDGKLFACHT